MEEFIRDLGEDRYAVGVYLGCLGVMLASTAGFFLLSWSWITAIVGVLIGFVIVSLIAQIAPLSCRRR